VDIEAAGMEETQAKNTASTDGDFRRKVEEIENQLGLTVDGNFDHLVHVET
jgi:hypothetical protein